VDEADDHPGMPRNADEVPIFFVLPPELQASYDKKMRRCERGWQTTHDPAFVGEAQILTHFYRQPLPRWLTEVVAYMWAAKRRSKEHIARAFNARIRFMRYEAVQAAKRAGLSWDAAYAHAAELLAGTRAAGRPRTMKADYIEVKADLNDGRGARYFIPRMPRKELGAVLGVNRRENNSA
jgi:hypothetical protein